jgi:ABC-type lipoprotein export system ATPase subunit
MFEIKSVSRRFGAEYALRDITMTIGSGLNFIIGSSGSGKTTLLKIMSGMETDFEGEVIFCGRDIKKLSAKERAAMYNQVFGFVWQDFNLLEDRTVLENILLPQYLQAKPRMQDAKKILRELKINELANQKAAKLSGGQKQRVAIARELMKNPQVILADEPTSALDEASAKNTIEILRTLAKNRTVIVVTHDTSFIDNRSKVYELDKGELTSVPERMEDKAAAAAKKKHTRVTIPRALQMGMVSIKRGWGRTLTMSLAMLISAALLLVSVSGAVKGSGQSSFDKLFATYGEGLLDISLASSFISAGGTNGQEKDEPNIDVNQNLDGLFEKYSGDPRTSHILFAQAIDDISVIVDNKEYSIESTGNMPVMNKLAAGTMPMGSGNEVAVPESFVKMLGITNEQAIGKELTLHGKVNNWESGELELASVEVKAKISGVINTNMAVEFEGVVSEYPINDSFFFSPAALKEMRENAGMKAQPGSFYIRAKTPADMISLKDELNANGIVPLGRFELVEDMVRLGQQTMQQSGSATLVIGLLSILVVLAVALIGAVLRKREYAICKVSGFSGTQLTGAAFAEFSLLTAGTSILFLLFSPLLNLATTTFWNVSILNFNLLCIGALLTVGMGLLSASATAMTAITTNAVSVLKTGDR